MLKGDKINRLNHQIANSRIMSAARFVVNVSAETGMSHADVVALLAVIEEGRRNDIEIDKYNIGVENDFRDNVSVRAAMQVAE